MTNLRMKKAHGSDINVNLVFLDRKDNKAFETLGRVVYEHLMRESSKRVYMKYEGKELTCRECIVHGS